MWYRVSFSLFLLVFLPTVVAAQAINHKVTPRVIDREVEPREAYQEVLTIENFQPHKITIFPSVNAVTVDAGGDIVDFVPPSMSDNRVTVTSWLEISRAGIELGPGATTSLPLTIDIHPQAEPGVYHAFVGFGTGRNRDIAEQQVAQGIAPGVVVTLSVSQNNYESLRLDGFYIDRFITGSGDNAVTYTLKNPGVAAVVPRGEIIVSNNRGEEVRTIPVNPEALELGANETRVHTASLDTSNLLGKYKAFLTVDYGSEQLVSVYDTVFFYVVPWRQILIFFGVISFIVILLTLIIYRRYETDEEEDDEHGADYIPLFIKADRSTERDHDIDLKNR